ncbi:MAG: sigma-70 family RNA polymerase sigma factor [Dehalococcoidia bacterium]
MDAAGAFARGANGPGAYAGLSDAALMGLVTARDADAFAAIYERYVDIVYSTALRVLGEEHMAEDVAQDVFVRLWRRPEAFVAERGRFLSWILSVARNRAVDELRSQARRRRRETHAISTAGDEYSTDVPCESDATNPLAAAELFDAQVRVRSALCEIPLEQRRALELAYFRGLTQEEIATVLREPLGTIKTRIRLGMQKLRRALEDEV